MLQNDVETLRGLTQLAVRFGPFLFAVFYGILAPIWAWRNYALQTDPKKATTARHYFWVVVTVGVVLIGATSIWWFMQPPVLYVYQGTIRQLDEQMKISSTELYLKSRPLVRLSPQSPEQRHEDFLIVKSEPFIDTDTFTIRFFKVGGDETEHALRYSEARNPQFTFEFDEVQGRMQLRPLAAPAPADTRRWNTLFPTLHASTRAPLESAAPQTAAQELSHEALIGILQEERSAVGAKIRALKGLSEGDVEELASHVARPHAEEPLFLTLLDLTRHSDTELSYWASRLVSQVKVESIVADQLQSGDARARQALYRMAQDRAKRVLGSLPPEFQPPWLDPLRDRIDSGTQTHVLVPTGSAEGDRYYVRLRWNRRDTATVECLAENVGHLMFDPKADALQALNTQTEALAYWYSKDLALSVGESAEQCGGQPSFVSGLGPK